MKIYIIIFITLIVQPTYSQTVIKDGAEIFGQWKATDSPFVIEGTAIVPEGKVLEISSGTVVKFRSASASNPLNFTIGSTKVGRLVIRGTLISNGTKNTEVFFDSEGTGKWGSIYFDSLSKDNAIRYTIIKNSHGINHLKKRTATYAAIVLNASELLIDNSVIVKNFRGIQTEKSNLTIQNSALIANEETGLMISNFDNNIMLKNSIIWGSFYCIFWSRTDITKKTGSPQIEYLVLENNLYDFTGKYIYAEEPTFENIESGNYQIKNGSFYMKKGRNKGKIGVQ